MKSQVSANSYEMNRFLESKRVTLLISNISAQLCTSATAVLYEVKARLIIILDRQKTKVNICTMCTVLFLRKIFYHTYTNVNDVV